MQTIDTTAKKISAAAYIMIQIGLVAAEGSPGPQLSELYFQLAGKFDGEPLADRAVEEWDMLVNKARRASCDIADVLAYDEDEPVAEEEAEG